MSRHALVPDANILVRAVPGQRVFKLLDAHYRTTALFAKRGLDWAAAANVLARLPALIQCVEESVYGEFEIQARQRIRDVRDWPVLACALALDCPVRTEDQDFFGSGVATWITSTVTMCLTDTAT